MLWCALALLVSQPPQPCLGCARRRFSPTVTPHAAPLKRGEDALAPPPSWPSFYAQLRCDELRCSARICCAMPCETALCSATLCYDVFLGELIAARLVL